MALRFPAVVTRSALSVAVLGLVAAATWADVTYISPSEARLKEDVAFRKKVAEQVGIGFELPAEKAEVAPICTQSGSVSTFA